ncbi:hypothetical protein [Chryseobacterium sp. KMC2]|uniref:hypothetical protein n=1 Tax=Chryseobacterium sp. KMC2 TaxID=2800705 RepID=UPI001920B1F1|nr:hypothetical protein [Chryseobacterium sp. KMC2]MBL3545952.1 hypothetical protein [Chryseobacterium sp. KMC2]
MNTKKKGLDDIQPVINADLPAEDGAMRINATRINYAYIFEREGPNPSDNDLVFSYDMAGNQVNRKVVNSN